MSQAGALLLSETLRATGLGRDLASGLARWRVPRAGGAGGEQQVPQLRLPLTARAAFGNGPGIGEEFRDH